jgi:DNA-binding transcriptional ArsR family regulator
MNGQPPIPLDHRVRRRILRRLNEFTGPHTAINLSTDLRLKLPEILYHAGVLAKYEKVAENRKGVDRADTRFESMVADDSEVIALLVSTEADDEAQ